MMHRLETKPIILVMHLITNTKKGTKLIFYDSNIFFLKKLEFYKLFLILIKWTIVWYNTTITPWYLLYNICHGHKSPRITLPMKGKKTLPMKAL